MRRTVPLSVLGLALALATTVAAAPTSPAQVSQSLCEQGEDERPAVLVEPVELCGVTTIRGISGSVAVRVPTDVPFEVIGTRSPSFTITSTTDAFSGFVLGDGQHRELAGFRFPASMRDGDDPRFATGGYNFLHPAGEGEASIPAGEYRLWVFSEGETPVDVELRLEGLPGRVDLVPTRPSSVEIVRLGARYPTPDANVHFQGGHEIDVPPGGGKVISAIALKGEQPYVGRMSLCEYQGGTTSEASYLTPSCLPYPIGGPGGYGGWPVQPAGSIEQNGSVSQMWTAGYLSYPRNAVVASGTLVGGTHATALAAWISFD